jgi:hypothetical protein
MQVPEVCRTLTRETKIVFSEKGRRMLFLNPRRMPLERCRIDSCPELRQQLSIQDSKLCDFCLVDWRPEEHFIELKGKNVDHALRQLEATLNLLRQSPQKLVHAWIITSESPASQPKFLNLKERFMKRLNVKLTIRTNQHEHHLG